MKSSYTIGLHEARSIAISRQFDFDSKRKNKLLNIFEQLGYIQIDTISIVERSHHHILWSRMPEYRRSMLDTMLEQDRSIFEYWSHAASYLPMRDYRFSLPRKFSYYTRHKDWRTQNKRLIKFALDRIKNEGPLSSRDFEGKSSGQSGWWNHKPAKAVLEFLFHTGELMVSSRKNFSKYYDLPENVISPETDATTPDRIEMLKHLIETSVSAHGIISDREILYLRGKADEDFHSAMNELVEAGMISSVKINEIPGITFRTKDEYLKKPFVSDSDLVRILSPFDNLIIQRSRVKALFDYSYTLECYVPEPKRKFGYFCLPVLSSHKFIGIVDCKVHRAKQILEVISFHPSGLSKSAFKEEIAESLIGLAKFAGCDRLIYRKLGNVKL
jgi:uncharacterized protein YcaQ